MFSYFQICSITAKINVRIITVPLPALSVSQQGCQDAKVLHADLLKMANDPSCLVSSLFGHLSTNIGFPFQQNWRELCTGFSYQTMKYEVIQYDDVATIMKQRMDELTNAVHDIPMHLLETIDRRNKHSTTQQF